MEDDDKYGWFLDAALGTFVVGLTIVGIVWLLGAWLVMCAG